MLLRQTLILLHGCCCLQMLNADAGVYENAARVVDMYCTVVALGIDTVYADGACVVDSCCLPVVVR